MSLECLLVSCEYLWSIWVIVAFMQVYIGFSECLLSVCGYLRMSAGVCKVFAGACVCMPICECLYNVCRCHWVSVGF